MTIRNRKGLLALVPAALAMAVPTLAQAPMAAHRPNIIQRHPTMTGVAAGAGVHHALKVSARNKKAHGQRLNFAERHPTLAGIGTAIGTRHEIKKHTAH